MTMDLTSYIDDAAARFNLPPAIIRAYANAESGGNPGLQGPMTRHGWRAQGAMQMAPATYAEVAQKHGLGPDPMNPADNITAGAAYLRQLTDKYGADPELVALAWNAGPGYAEKYLRGEKGMPDQTRALYSRINQNLAAGGGGGPAGGVNGGGGNGGWRAAVAPPRPAGFPAPPFRVPAAALGGLLSPPAGPAPAAGGGITGLLDNQDALAGAAAALAPLAGQQNRRVGMGEVLAALGGGVVAGEQAGRQRRAQEFLSQMSMSDYLDKKAAAGQQKAAAEAYAKQLEAVGQPELAAAVRADPATMKEIAGQQAKSVFPNPLSPGDRFKPVGPGHALVDVTTGQPVYQGSEDAAKAKKDSFEAEHKLRSAFEGLQTVKNLRQLVPIVESVRTAVGRDTPAADLNIIYSLAKVLDPESVVLSTEMQLGMGTGSPAERVSGLYNYVLNGGRLTGDTREKLLDEIKSRYKESASLYKSIASDYRSTASSWGVDPSRVVGSDLPDWEDNKKPAAGAAAGARPAAAPAAPPAQRAHLGDRVIVIKDGRWVFEDDGSAVPQ